jgi:translation initiation factor eIF-2B subunit epsilon
MLLTDNFDYQDLRTDFICGVLGSEILGHRINTHVVQGAYAARVKDLWTYDSISKDVIHRWTFPMVTPLAWCL